MLGWGAEWKQDPFQLWHSSQADVPESSNAGAYQNPEVDKLIDELRVTLNPKKQIELYHKIHRIIFDDQPYTFLFADMQNRFEYLQEGLAVILAFVGVKMVIERWVHISTVVSLIVIVLVLVGAVVASVVHPSRSTNIE